MPDEDFNVQLGLGPKPYKNNSYGDQGPTASYGYTIGGRTVIKRPKPRDAFIKPTPYQTHVETVRNLSVRADITGSTDDYIGIDGPVQPFGAFLNQGLVEWFPDFSNNLYNGVITDLRLKVKDSQVNLAQAWAERHRTANLLADSITRIAKATMLLRRGRWKQAGKMLKQSWKKAPQSWLEYQYGWKPLMQDVFGSVEALKKFGEPDDWLLSVKSGRKVEAKKVKIMETSINTLYHGAYLTGESFQGIFARADYAPSSTFFQNLSSNTGILNPLLLAWEFQPFSFVIDWGAQVGNWLSSLDATLYMEFLGGSYTDRREVNIVLTPKSGKSDYGSYTSWRNNDQPSARKFQLVRTTWDSWPIAAAPRFKDPLSLLHVANALSLLAVALKPGIIRFR